MNGGITFIKDPATANIGTGCLYDFAVYSADGEIVWKIRRPGYQPPPCESNFPLRYGVMPNGFTTIVRPKPLKHGVIYGMRGSDGDHAYGSFSFGVKTIGVVHNFAKEPSSPTEKLECLRTPKAAGCSNGP